MELTVSKSDINLLSELTANSLQRIFLGGAVGRLRNLAIAITADHINGAAKQIAQVIGQLSIIASGK